MEKLTEAGRLYLTDFYILDEARDDLFTFLNYITDQVYEKWLEHKNAKELFNKEPNLIWGGWKNKSTPGYMDFAPRSEDDNEYGLLEKGKTGITLSYGDIRHRSALYNPASIQLNISVVNNVRKKLNQVSPDKMKLAIEELNKYNIDIDLDKRSIYKTQVGINPNEPQSTVEEILDTIIEKCQGIETLIKSCS